MTPTPFTTRLLPWVLTAGGALGLVAAFVLTVEKIALLKNPDYIPTCSIDPILSCGSIMRTAQAEVFGFPNPLLGIVGFTAVVTIGVVVVAGGSLPRWFWLGLQGGALLGVVFVHWLIYQSLYVISALCPYCMVVWVVTIPVFWYTTVHNLREGHLPAPRRLVTLATCYHGVVLTVWYTGIALLVLHAFWSYWLSLT
ncbi:vitamin K epoxide reductase family protein [Saccharothrix saharensis]|uniref:vitamin K epoxide reductase family protein n=1 Tax=Saccharothrix saharensis TaxID=571190 RepID=UPI0036C86DC5